MSALHRPPRRRHHTGQRCANRRAGAAMVELAICLPVIAAIVLATIEVTSLMYCKQALTGTAHECARVAAKPTSTDEDVRRRGEEIASQLGMRAVTVETQPESIEGLRPGDQIRVIVRADTTANGYIRGRVYRSQRVVTSCVVVKDL